MIQKKATSAFRYAIGMFGTSIPINMFKTYASAYYVFGRNPGHNLETDQLALIVFIYTFVDAIDNPVYGFLSDRTRTKWGRRRPWLVAGTPLLILSFVLFFSAPETFQGGSLFVFALLTYVMTGTLDSLINANYGALFPELFVSDAERAKANGMRQVFQLVAMVISVALTPLVTEQLGYSLTAVIYGVLAGAVILYCTFGCKESSIEEVAEKPQLLKTVRDILTNPKFWAFGLTNAFYGGAMAMVLSGIPFFVKYVLDLDGKNNTVLMGAVLLAGMIGIIGWVQIVRRVDSVKVWKTALLLFALAFIPLFFTSGLVPTAAACMVAGLCGGGIIATMDLMGARIMDADTEKTGVRREASYSSTIGFMGRLNGLFSSAALLFVNRVYGFESGDVPGERPADAARFLFVIAPFVLMLLGVVCSRFLNFDHKEKKETKQKTIDEKVEASWRE
ncbi:MAG: MFS transporter [Oscillospiraceae bacterium]|jgi:GPH family glycoside/pentoside/hexuronide:cation symporter|nr:MFS transporter [Oscillospiraceae bacterium]